MSTLNTNLDNDFESFFNIDNNDYTPVPASPAAKPVPSLAHQSSSGFSTSQQSFVPPSYQYGSHRQQTGLPIGGLQNTFAINQATGLHYRPNQMGFIVPTETLNIPFSNTMDDFDFSRNQSIDMNDMDFDAESPSDGSNMFGGGESSQSTPYQRIYPGMHTAQAAQAKAAQAQKQQEMLQQQQRQKQLTGQQPLPTSAPKASNYSKEQVEEAISSILREKRQSSSSSVDESTPGPMSGMSGLVRPKKEEDDMDDDERLLASEEGKKLSSKERRQLRNKVSARAFRSRRKEYIGQLEAEVQQKSQEAENLRTQNRQLMEENTRLTDLTRMLLSSPSFSGFLQELSNSGSSAPQVNQTPTSQPAQPTQGRKDISLHDAARQLQSQNQPTVGMAMVPEPNLNMSGLESNWNSLPTNDFQVFTVTNLPIPSNLDMTFDTIPSKDIPQLPSLPASVESALQSVVDLEPSHEADGEDVDDLYSRASVRVSTPIYSAQSLIASLRKPDYQSETDNAETKMSAGAPADEADLEKLCQALEDSCLRLARFMPPKTG